MGEIVAIVTDLFFQSRIAAAARAAGRDVRFVSQASSEGAPGSLALVDLDSRTDVNDSIERLKRSGATVIAFGPHVDTRGRRAARAAGADRVLAKSKFVTDLPKIMRGTTSET
jgi:hypothetical protein